MITTNTKNILNEFTNNININKQYSHEELTDILYQVYNQIYNTNDKSKKNKNNMKKREPTAYNLFVKNNMNKVKNENPNLSHKDLMKKISELWKNNK